MVAMAQCLAGVGLMGWAALFHGLSGWGIGFSDLRWNLGAVLPWLAPLALGPLQEARSSTADRRRAFVVLTGCGVAAIGAMVADVAGRAAYPAGPGSFPMPLLLVLIPVAAVVFFLAFLSLAIPVLAARSRWGRIVSWIPFVLALALALFPARLVESGHLRGWLLLTTGMLVSLGVALLAVGLVGLFRKSSPAEGLRSRSMEHEN